MFIPNVPAQEAPPGGAAQIRFAKNWQRGDLPPADMPGETVTPEPSPGVELLTLAELENLALSNNPAIALAAARIQAARGRWLQAGLPPNPVVAYQGSEMGNEGTAGQQGGYIGQQFITGGKLQLDRQVADRAAFEMEQRLALERARVLSDVRSAYFTAVAAQRRVELARRLVRVGQEGVSAANDLFRAQEASRNDVLQANIQANTALIEARTAENNRRAAWRRLAALVGVHDMQVKPLEDLLDGKPPRLDWQQTLERLVSTSPEMSAAVARVEQAEWRLDRAIVEPRPNVNVQAGVQHDNGTSDTITSVTVQMPVPVFNRNQGGIRRAQAELAQARAAVSRVELDLQQRLAVVFQRYSDAQFRVEKYAGDILPDAQRSLDLVTVGYREGEFGYLNVLTAQRTYFRTHLDYVESLRQLHAAYAEIDGFLLTGSLSER